MITIKDTERYLSRALPITNPRTWPWIFLILALIAGILILHYGWF